MINEIIFFIIFLLFIIGALTIRRKKVRGKKHPIQVKKEREEKIKELESELFDLKMDKGRICYSCKMNIGYEDICPYCGSSWLL